MKNSSLKKFVRLTTIGSAMAFSLGCKGGPGASGGGECGAIGTKVAKMMTEEMGKQGPKEMAAKIAPFVAEISGAIAASCKEDGWPADAVKCMATASDTASLTKCGDSMKDNDVLSKKMETRMKPIVTKMMGTMMGGAGAPSMAPPPTAGVPNANPGSAPTGAMPAPAAVPPAEGAAPMNAPAPTAVPPAPSAAPKAPPAGPVPGY